MTAVQTQQHARAILLLSIAAFASAASARLCDPMLPDLAHAFSASSTEVAHVVSGFSVAYGLLQAIFGPLGDRIGKYRLIAFTTLACTVGSLGAALASSLDLLVLSRILTGATAAGIIPLSMAWIGDTVPYEERQPTLARFLGGQILGVIGGQFIGGFFADTLGWRWAFAFLCLVYFLVGIFVLLESHRNPSTHHQSTPSSTGRGLIAQASIVLGTPWARVIIAVVFLEGMTVFGALAFVPTYLHERFELTLSMSGALVGLFGVGGFSYIAYAKYFVRRLGEKGLALLGGVLIASAWALLAFGPTWAFATAAAYLAGLGFYMLHNTLQTNATQMAPQVRGTSVSLFASSFFLGQSLGVILAAKLLATQGAFALFIAATVLMPLIGIVFSRLLRNKPQ
ncbi:MFS transporter [Dechloromonas sp. HYN0024]|uniref:MFS transporter n=1 Tax=Dechloromonas sp. HYN0024 TaxID=2231055 RepID=UPI000E432A6D|nr:MFS transporter [Dechloromonas sp. HYN0024]AXS79626.1 MFS transporter [Dechloromonas sp. HYN0024]